MADIRAGESGEGGTVDRRRKASSWRWTAKMETTDSPSDSVGIAYICNLLSRPSSPEIADLRTRKRFPSNVPSSNPLSPYVE